MSLHLTARDRAQIIGMQPTTLRIAATVASMSGLKVADIKGSCRRAELVLARDVVCYVAHREGISLSAIGRALNRDHSTIATAVRREAARRSRLQAA